MERWQLSVTLLTLKTDWGTVYLFLCIISSKTVTSVRWVVQILVYGMGLKR